MKNKTAIDACSLLAKQAFSDLVGEPASSLIINFEQVIEPFLVLNIYFTFFLSVVDCTFYKSTIKSNCILLLLSGQLPPEENCPPLRVGVSVKVRISFRVEGQPENCPGEKLTPGQGQGSGQFWGWGAIFFGGNYPRTIIIMSRTRQKQSSRVVL